MDSSLCEYKNGISGYSPQGAHGLDGADGNMIHFSSYDSNHQTKIKQKINSGYEISNNNLYENVETEYNIGDVVLTIDCMMYRIIKNQSNQFDLVEIGEFKPINYNINEESGENDLEPIIFEIKNKVTFENDYNYYDVQTIYWHNRDSADQNCYGNLIKAANDSSITDIIDESDSSTCKFVLNFKNGLRFEKILNNENYDSSIIIDNRYFYSYGIRNNVFDGVIFQDYGEEMNYDSSTHLKTESNKSLVDGYIEYTSHNQLYIRKIKIT